MESHFKSEDNVFQPKNSSSYVSCIEIDGRPILPPLMTEAKRQEMRKYKELAIALESRRNKNNEVRQKSPPLINLIDMSDSENSNSGSDSEDSSTSTSSYCSYKTPTQGDSLQSLKTFQSPSVCSSTNNESVGAAASTITDTVVSEVSCPSVNSELSSIVTYVNSSLHSNSSSSTQVDSCEKDKTRIITASTTKRFFSSPTPDEDDSMEFEAESVQPVTKKFFSSPSPVSSSFEITLSTKIPSSAETTPVKNNEQMDVEQIASTFQIPIDSVDVEPGEDSDKENTDASKQSSSNSFKKRHVRNLSYTLDEPSEALVASGMKVGSDVPDIIGSESSVAKDIETYADCITVPESSNFISEAKAAPSTEELDNRLQALDQNLEKLQLGVNINRRRQLFERNQEDELDENQHHTPISTPVKPSPTHEFQNEIEVKFNELQAQQQKQLEYLMKVHREQEYRLKEEFEKQRSFLMQQIQVLSPRTSPSRTKNRSPEVKHVSPVQIKNKLSKLQAKMKSFSPSYLNMGSDSNPRSPLLKGVVFPKPLNRANGPVRIPPKAQAPEMQPKFARATAYVRGYLTRRLLHTEKIQGIIQTIRDTVDFIMKLYEESPIDPASRAHLRPEDMNLHRLLMQQLKGACSAFHDIFFKLSIPERMAIIATDRQKLKAKALREKSQGKPLSMSMSTSSSKFKRNISAATIKAMERRLSFGRPYATSTHQRSKIKRNLNT